MAISIETVGILLAGGQSKRMGTDKASLLWRGRRLVDVMVERLYHAVGTTGCVRVSGFAGDLPYGMSGDALGRSWSVADEMPGQGPLEGVRSVLRQMFRDGLECRTVLIVPVDMPLLRTPHLRSLLQRPLISDARLYEESELPLVLRLSEKLRARLEMLCDERTPARDRSFRGLLSGLESERVRPETHPSSEEFLLNTNTPEEWKSALL